MDRMPEKPEESGRIRPEFGICQGNLSYLDAESGMLRSQADAICEDCVRTILNAYRALPNEEAVPLPAFFSAFVSQHLLPDVPDRNERTGLLFRLCRHLSLRMSDPEIREALLAYLHIEQPEMPALRTILYVNNPQIQSALRSFSSVFPDAEAVPCLNFSDGCEDVASGNADACVIPLITSQDGLLHGFISTLDRFDLKISNICSVRSYGEEQPERFTMYALARRDLILPREDEPVKIVLELYFSGETPLDSLPLAELRSVLSVSLIQSVPDARLSGVESVYLILDAHEAKGILPFLMFLREAKIAYAILGLCPNPK